MSLRFVSVVLVLVLFGCGDIANSVLMETHTVKEGSFRGFTIGSSKEVALRRASELGAYAVSPIPPVWFVINHSNLEYINHVKQVEGIRITDYKGLAIDLFFSNDKIHLVRRSVPAKGNTWFQEGEEISAVLVKLTDLLRSDHQLQAFPLVLYEGDGWIKLGGDFEAALKNLSRYDAWTFEVSSDKPAGSVFQLYFVNDRLSRLEYRRPRFQI